MLQGSRLHTAASLSIYQMSYFTQLGKNIASFFRPSPIAIANKVTAEEEVVAEEEEVVAEEEEVVPEEEEVVPEVEEVVQEEEEEEEEEEQVPPRKRRRRGQSEVCTLRRTRTHNTCCLKLHLSFSLTLSLFLSHSFSHSFILSPS